MDRFRFAAADCTLPFKGLGTPLFLAAVFSHVLGSLGLFWYVFFSVSEVRFRCSSVRFFPYWG